jgi:hypothetical protein
MAELIVFGALVLGLILGGIGVALYVLHHDHCWYPHE